MKAFFLIALTNALLSAQGVCVLDQIKTDVTQDLVLFVFQGQHRVLTEGMVFLRDLRHAGRQIAAKVRADGSFHLRNVKPDKYVLEARHPAGFNLDVEIRVLPDAQRKSSSRILILLGSDAKVCGGSSITVEPLSKVRRILSDAKK